MARRIKAKKEELEKEARDLSARDFACDPGAGTALADLMKKADVLGFLVSGNTSIKETKSYSHKGLRDPG